MVFVLLFGLGLIGTISSTIFLVLAVLGVWKFRIAGHRQSAESSALGAQLLPPVSILKPLHGLEARLESNLESFFKQDYPRFEVLFGVDEADDAALPVAERVCAKYPEIPSRILVTGKPAWPNPVASSFFRLAEAAQYEILVTSDSDVLVGPDYLRSVAPPLTDPKTGMLTCVYRGLAAGGFWSSIDSIGMSIEMTAGVLVANLIEGMKFGLGPTIVVRKDALEAIGGYEFLGHYVSNDFVLGKEIAKAGYKIVLSPYIISHVAPPMTFTKMWRRHLRWAIGTRYSRPKGHFGSGLVFAIPYGLMSLAGGILLDQPFAGVLLAAWSVLNRALESLLIGWGITRDPECLRKPWLFPLRDLLGFTVWVASYLASASHWRVGRFHFAEDGRMVLAAPDEP
ncbi:MAG TPA: glycosyltransferase [Bryobacteraceae bacterium]|jgi:ceramide glucosyltransferase|nr:glycosyltransferase [Bryobacteraceae bacterium]